MFINLRCYLACWLMDSEDRELLETIASLRVKEKANANYRLKRGIDDAERSLAEAYADNEKLKARVAELEKSNGDLADMLHRYDYGRVE